MKPDVVFFGENVPRQRVDEAMDALARAGGLLVVGSSLTVYSGFRFCRRAQELGLPIAAINDGVTRADDMLAVKAGGPCAEVLASLATEAGARSPDRHRIAGTSSCACGRPD